MKDKPIILLFVCFLFTNVEAQTPRIVKSFNLPFTPVAASIDQQGFFYFASNEGVIEKYNSEGELQYHYSPQKKAKPTLIESWQGLRVFIYYQAFQEYLFLNRFLTDSERYNLQRFNLSQFSGLATLSGDNNLWLIDSNTLILSKLDINSGEILLANILSLSLTATDIRPAFIREYQNLLFIADQKNGILVFDNLGNYVETIAQESISFFSFHKNNLIVAQQGKIIIIDIYSKQKREIGTANLSYEKVFMENNQFFALSGKRVDILSIN